MNAKIEEFDIRPNLKIRKGSIVALDFHEDSRPIEAEVTGIFLHNDEVIIESVTCGYGSPMTHNVWQYEESAKLIKF